MADHRDIRRPKTPPAGIRAQTAGESWDDSHTPPPGGAPLSPDERLGKIDRRIKITAATSQTTLDNLGELRREFDAKATRLDERIEGLAGDMANVREVSARFEGKLDVLMQTLAEERERGRQYTQLAVTTFQAGIEVDKTRALSQIDERKEAVAYRRQLLIRFLSWAAAAIAAVWALIATIALARYR